MAEKLKEFTVRIGELLRNVLDKQKENIKVATEGCVLPSDLEVGEMIAKKILNRRLV